METIKDKLTACEDQYLSPFAARSSGIAKEDFQNHVCSFRTAFQQDRDRIIHSKAFRRLMHKTQCFLSPEGDHYRTRLTHTLEVSQIARTLARALRLNEDLTEAMALGHDLGHTPFGHAGERTLHQLCPGGFRHNEQSIRVVTLYEKEGVGLRLCAEVKDGIVCHTGATLPNTLEGKLLRYADKIAYINHDIDDAVRAGILTENDLPANLREVLGQSHSSRIDTMVNSLIVTTANYFDQGKAEVAMDPLIGEATMQLRQFLFANVYFNPAAKGEEQKACAMLEHLYEYFVKHADKMPAEYKSYIDHDPLERVVCDYLAGMTDRYAVDQYEELFIPKMWGVY